MSETNEQTLAQTIRDCNARGETVAIRGHNSKHFYGNQTQTAHTINTTGDNPLAGIIEYEPSELYVGAWAGTPLDDIRKLLADNRQILPFDPPTFNNKGTIGGAIAAGLSGPSRVAGGGVRDAMLGITLVNGEGEILNFGGRVIKNVAGYDISRLNAGAMGTLGLITRAYVRAAPAPAAETTRALQMPPNKSAAYLQKLARAGATISATFHDGEMLYLRLSSSTGGIGKMSKHAGGEECGNELWRQLRDHEHPFFRARKENETLWRISLPPNSGYEITKGEQVCEWNNALIWSRANKPANEMRALAKQHNGSACLFYKGGSKEDTFERPPETSLRLQKELKKAFDPKGILNPHRLHRNI